jgi:hypothetical protein
VCFKLTCTIRDAHENLGVKLDDYNFRIFFVNEKLMNSLLIYGNNITGICVVYYTVNSETARLVDNLADFIVVVPVKHSFPFLEISVITA